MSQLEEMEKMTEEQARQVIANRDYRIETTHEELVALIKGKVGQYTQVHVALGTGDLIWEKGKPTPNQVIELMRMRGMFDVNVGGDGI